MATHSSLRLLMIGIDGADYRLTRYLMRCGQLPHLEALSAAGAWGPAESTIPPVTPPAWTTIMTGKNPGKHGVFDFLPMAGETWETPIASRRRAKTVWRALSEQDLRVGTFNLPATYPPEPLSGFQVSGFDGPGFQHDLATPPEAFDVLRAAVGDYEMFPSGLRGPHIDLPTLERYADIPVLGTRALLKAFACDVYMVNFQIIDWVHHVALGAQMQPLEPDSLDPEGTVAQAYRLVDERVGALLDEWAGPETVTMVLSDHGGTVADRVVNLERLLLDNGLMAYTSLFGTWSRLRRLAPGLARLAGPIAWRLRKTVAPEQPTVDVKIDYTRTRAVPWGQYAQVRANVRGRDPEGIVPLDELHDVLSRVRELLSSVVDPITGEPVYAQVLRGRDIYRGPFIPDAPDVIARPSSERYLSVTARSGLGNLPAQAHDAIVTALDEPIGTHSSTGLLMMGGPMVREGSTWQRTGLADIVPTVLYMLGRPIPEDMDGRPILEAMDPTFVEANPPCGGPPWSPEGQDDGRSAYTDEERQAVEERLRSLGYL